MLLFLLVVYLLTGLTLAGLLYFSDSKSALFDQYDCPVQVFGFIVFIFGWAYFCRKAIRDIFNEIKARFDQEDEVES